MLADSPGAYQSLPGHTSPPGSSVGFRAGKCSSRMTGRGRSTTDCSLRTGRSARRIRDRRHPATRCSPSPPSAIGKATDADPERGDDGQEPPVTKTPARGRVGKLFAKCQVWPTGLLIGAGELKNFSAFLCGGAKNDITAMSAFLAINASAASHGLIDPRI